ncbi:penicillin-binding transpeptidase domain-containing protein [Metabacillus litoralis]|uniref:penicillin-binding transpeptidase domain-containing protein n=1 Tax=Metabacillus litoralis TaxID=152268 RepID=UPI00299ED085|nr:penicillin-binding transpeptidase domain-containing protein [Metabacillus litoralis]
MKLTQKNKNMNRGAAVLSVFFALLFLIIFIRFFYIQSTGTVHGEALVAKVEELYKSQRTIEAERGSILDRKGNVIAEDKSSYKLVAILDDKITTDPDKPQHVVDVSDTTQKLAPLINMEISEVEKLLSKDLYQVEFGVAGRDISHSLKEEITKLDLPGIIFSRDTQRFYPNGIFASHLIGYAQKQENDGEAVGMMGLEKTLDKYLHEEDGFVKYQKDGYNWKLPNSKDEITAPENGNDVYLTIDQKIQTFLEDAMNQVVDEYTPEKIIGVVADPKTGKILAMSQRPSFDPNVRDINSYYNDVVSSRYEPGSTMKIFTLASAIEEGVYNGNATFQSGSYSVDGPDIYDHNKVGWGPITFNEGVQRSSNVGFSIIADKLLGTDRFYQYLNSFGFLKPTGIDLPDEVNSKFNFTFHRDKVSTSFGQASAVTPIQQIQAATAIANGGKMMKPFVIEKIVNTDTNETVKETKPTIVGEPISDKTSKEVLDLLETVVTGEKGTGKLFKIDGYQVAGKTGTAQMYSDSGEVLRGHDNYIFSFLGMAPKEDPELIVYVAVQRPKLEGQAGAMPVSKIFNTVMKNSLQYLQIDPTDTVTGNDSNELNQGIKLPSFKDQNIKEVTANIEKLGLKPVILGEGPSINSQYPDANTSMIIDEKVMLKTSDSVKMPDMKGWSRRDVMKLGYLLNLTIKTEGSGFVVKQSIKKGSIVKQGDLLTISLDSQKPTVEKSKKAEDKDQ